MLILLDGKSHENFGATLATFGTTSGTGGRIRCTAPFNTNSGKMFQVTVSLYTSYQVRNYVVAGYMYSTSNQWYSATAIYSGAGTPDIKVGRDSSGKAYISIARGSYTGVRVHSMTRGYYTSVADTYDPWTITENDATENSLTPTTSTTWHSTNDGSGSGLDADLLDGQQGSYYYAASNPNGYTNDQTAAEILTAIKTVDGSGSGLDADTVDGKHKDYLMHYKGLVSGNWDTIFSQTDGHMGVYEVHNLASGHSNYPTGAYTYGGVMSWQLDNSTFKLYAPHTGQLHYQTGWNNDEYSGWRKIWDTGNDGSGSGLDADLLDGNQATAFATAAQGVLAASAVQPTANYAVTQRMRFTANETNNWDTIATGTGSQGSLEVFNTASGNDAFMAFHAGADYALYFGLDADTNKLAVGGWSMGAVKHAIYHEGNKPSLATLGYTGATNANYITNNNQLTNGSGYITSSGTANQSHMVSGSAFGTTSSPGSVLEYQQASGQTDTRLAPSGDWHNSIRMGHGNPYNYYSNTLAARMTGAYGDWYTQTIYNNTPQGWRKLWSTGNDGSGSGLDADLLDGYNAEEGLVANSITKRDGNINIQARRFIGGYSLAGDGQASMPFKLAVDQNSWMVSTAGDPATWGLFWAGNSGARYGTNGNGGPGNIWGNSSNPNEFTFVGGDSTAWTVQGSSGDTWQKGTARTADQGILWGASNDGAGSGLDADLLDGQQPSSTGGGSKIAQYASNGYLYCNNWIHPANGSGLFYNAGVHFYESGNKMYSSTAFHSATQGLLWGATNDGSGSGLDADLLDGLELHTGRNDNANKVVRTQVNGYCDFGWINTTSGVASGTPTRIYCSQDAYIRYYTPASLAPYILNQGSTKNSHTHPVSSITAGTFTGTFTMGTQLALVANNYGRGLFGVYASTRYQHVWSMGTAYKTSDDGTSYGNMYGLTYTHTNVGTGTNQSISGLSHQLQHRHNGVLTAAIGSGIWTSGNVTAYSDIAVKTNLVRIPNALEKVCSINGYTYERTDYVKDLEDPEAPDVLRQAGVVAQEVEKVLPEVVSGKDGNKAVAYGNIVALLIESIKELKDEVDELKRQLEDK